MLVRAAGLLCAPTAMLAMDMMNLFVTAADQWSRNEDVASWTRRLDVGSIDDDDMDPAEVKFDVSKVMSAISVFSLCMGCMALLVFGAIYYDKVARMRPSYERSVVSATASQDFRTSPFACCDNSSYCLYGCCCFVFRVADTSAAAGIWGYWSMVFGSIFLVALDGVASLSGCGPMICLLYGIAMWVARATFLTITRARIRENLNRKPNPSVSDFLLWCFCGVCAAIQEAKEVDNETSTRVECCFRLETENRIPLVGAAVSSPVGLQAPAGEALTV
mmetsp:Transcript_54474/g.100738  ORF Transcript_54474/g.100738 Transcript_54474/m.100738 type:complete len:276 (+) Transcript_54474:80-907(+)